MVSAVALGLLEAVSQLELANSPWGGLLLVVVSAALTSLDKMARDRALW